MERKRSMIQRGSLFLEIHKGILGEIVTQGNKKESDYNISRFQKAQLISWAQKKPYHHTWRCEQRIYLRWMP